MPWPLAGAVAEPRGHAHAGDVPRGTDFRNQGFYMILSTFLEKQVWELAMLKKIIHMFSSLLESSQSLEELNIM